MAEAAGIEYSPCTHDAALRATTRGVGELVLDEEPLDTFLKFPGRKGVAWINGFNLGRYWNIGPGDALYVPAPVLRRGRNEIVIFELHDLNAFEVELRPSRNW